MSRLRVLAAGLAVATLVVLASAAPASAHDKLAASSPKPGEALAAAPASVRLDFTGDVLAIGAVVVIADAAGEDWVAGEPTIEGTTVTAPVADGLPEAGYELRWRVVSGDGHAISGIIPFTIGDAEPLVREAQPSAVPVPAGDDAAASQTPQENGTLRVVLIGVGGAVIAIAAFALIRILTRRRHSSADTGAPASASREL